MGTIDDTTVVVSCEPCQVTEEKRALQKGSRWGADWQDFGSFEHFQTKETVDQRSWPKIASATCNKCGEPGQISYK